MLASEILRRHTRQFAFYQSTPSLPVSVVIIARNEEARIGDCIRSARRLTDDVVVVDSFSTDQTVQVARAAGARVTCREWSGYSAQKNYGNSLARHSWILSLDADERLSDELIESVRGFLKHDSAHPCCEIRFRSFVGAKQVRFGAWNPEYHVRLFDRRLYSWNESSVHEGLTGPKVAPVRLRGHIDHYTVRDFRELSEKTLRYSRLFAEQRLRRGKRSSWARVWLNPAFRFFRDYVIKLGVLDGRVGFMIAWEAARYTHLKYRPLLPVRTPFQKVVTRAVVTSVATAVSVAALAFQVGWTRSTNDNSDLFQSDEELGWSEPLDSAADHWEDVA